MLSRKRKFCVVLDVQCYTNLLLIKINLVFVDYAITKNFIYFYQNYNEQRIKFILVEARLHENNVDESQLRQSVKNDVLDFEFITNIEIETLKIVKRSYKL